MIKQIPWYEVEELWPIILPMVQKVVEKQQDWTAEGVKQKLITFGDPLPFQLWMDDKFILITQIQAYGNNRRRCLLFMCGGEDLEAIKAAEPSVKDWAKRQCGCDSMKICGREGWVSIWEGFKVTEYVMECKLG